QLLEGRIAIAKDALLYRIERTREAKPENAPILYMNGAWGKKLTTHDDVWEIFKARRATISLGYIGLYEVGSIFYGSNWEDNPKAKEFTLGILEKLRQYCDSWSETYDVH